MTDSPTTPLRYFASYNGEVKGPFDLDMIEAFILSGHYPQDVQICAEGSNEWKSHSLAVKAPPRPLPQQQSTRPVSSKPAAGIPKWVLGGGGILGVLIVMTLIKMFTGGGSAPPSSGSSSYAPTGTPSPYGLPTATPYPYGLTTPRSTTYSTPRTYNSTSVPAATPDEMIYKDLQGRSFRVSNSDDVRLSKQRDALTGEHSAISADQSKIDAYGNSLERMRTYLDRTNGAEVDTFNTKIEGLNSANTELKRRRDVYNRRVDAFNSELSRVGTPMR